MSSKKAVQSIDIMDCTAFLLLAGGGYCLTLRGIYFDTVWYCAFTH